jgi:hypothetical protein
VISTTFDILKFIETLKAADVFATKADVLAVREDIQKIKTEFDALKNVFATKNDVQEVKIEFQKDISELKSRMKVTEWMLTFIFAGVTTLILKAFF